MINRDSSLDTLIQIIQKWARAYYEIHGYYPTTYYVSQEQYSKLKSTLFIEQRVLLDERDIVCYIDNTPIAIKEYVCD